MIVFNGKEIVFKSFPNRELYFDENDILQNLSHKQINLIKFKFTGNESLIKLFIVTKYLQSIGVTNICLEILYMPYSRMDRKIKGYPFTLEYIAEFINSLNYVFVAVHTPHSNKTMKLINNSYEYSTEYKLLLRLFNDNLIGTDDTTIFFPDEGAMRRNPQISPYPTIYAKKERNLQTGEIISYDIANSHVEPTKNVVILDDLCSAGGTFMHASKLLDSYGFENIYLVVTHMENTMFENKQLLKNDLIKKIYTTNSIMNDKLYFHDKVVVMDILK